jgi:hypothetical protein
MKIKIFLSLIPLYFAACTKNYNIELPPNEKKLVVECYLENGKPMRALISESTNLLDTSLTPPIFIQAVVVISHGIIKDTLQQFLYIDSNNNKVYNYSSPKIVTANYISGETYRIDVFDNYGRHAYGTTQFIQPLEIESLTPVFNQANKAFCLTKFKDDPNTKDFFRLILSKNTVTDSTELDVLLDNSFANQNNEFVYGSGSSFKSGDIIYARVYRLTYDYYLYLSTIQNARTALVNPFAVSGEIVYNIKGGIGVFSALSYSQKSVDVP